MLCVSVSNRLDLYAPSPSWKTQQTARGYVRFSRVCFARALLPASPLFSRYSISITLFAVTYPCIPFSRVIFHSYNGIVAETDLCEN